MTVLEADPVHLGGLARTVDHDGYLCDVGGHRFYSKSAEVTRLWREILGDDLVLRRRKSRIYYRDFLAVGLVVEERRLFDDHWLYIHDPGVKVGRIQNVRSWSPEMVPDSGRNCCVMEYFCFEGDDFWTRGDAGLIACATRELVRLGLARPGDVSDGFVVRQKKAYPVYDPGYADRVRTIRRFVETECPGLHLVGRNGMHRCNNQDHAMMTAMLAVENVVAGKPRYDVWKVNQDAEYVEDGDGCSSDAGGRTVPRRVEQ